MGFKDVRDAPFNGYIYDKIPQFVDSIYLRPDKYNVRIEFDNGACNPALSAYELEFMIKYPSWIIEQNWGDVVAVLNMDYNGGYVFNKYDWFVNNVEYEIDSKPYIYSPQYLHTGDQVYVALQRVEDDYSICTCPIILSAKNKENVFDEPILFEVNRTNKILTFNVEQPIEIELYDVLGHCVFRQELLQYGVNQMQLPLSTNGVYIIKMKYANKNISQKILL